MNCRVGFGYDVHRIEQGRKFILGGVEVEQEGRGLLGHSDADALCHALTDAILGAAGLGDIGTHFPDTDPKYKGADSVQLLRHAWQKAMSQGWNLGNADITVIAERPKMGPHFPAIRKNLCQVFAAVPDQVNLKAKTNEKLGYLGRQEAVAVYAVVMLER